jgi:hypothetical protein
MLGGKKGNLHLIKSCPNTIIIYTPIELTENLFQNIKVSWFVEAQVFSEVLQIHLMLTGWSSKEVSNSTDKTFCVLLSNYKL